MSESQPSPQEIVLAHFIVSDDVERSRRFYTEVLGGNVVFAGEPTYVALSNSWIIINVGGGPTDDKPAVTLETPPHPDRVSSFLNIRVKDIEAVYAEWSSRGAQFLTPPKQHRDEIRRYIRDPDGHLIEVGQTTNRGGDWAPDQWSPVGNRGTSDSRIGTPRRQSATGYLTVGSGQMQVDQRHIGRMEGHRSRPEGLSSRPRSGLAPRLIRSLFVGAIGTSTMDAVLYRRYRRAGEPSDRSDGSFLQE